MTNKEKLLELKQCQNNECVCRKGFGLCPQCHGVLDELIASYRETITAEQIDEAMQIAYRKGRYADIDFLEVSEKKEFLEAMANELNNTCWDVLNCYYSTIKG